MRFSVRRLLLLGLVGLLLGGAFGFWQTRRTVASEETVPGTFLDTVGPGLCTMTSQLAAGRKTDAYNTFWNEVHLPAHALAAELTTAGDRAEAANFQRSKMAVERDLSTLAATLGPSVDALTKETRTALAAAGRPVPEPCP